MNPSKTRHSLLQNRDCDQEEVHYGQYDTGHEVPGCHDLEGNESSTESPPRCSHTDSSVASSSSSMDGGYGWVIVIASFFNAFIVDGIGSSFGLLFPYIVFKFQASAFVTSFAGSLFVAFLIMGSISAWLVRRFGFQSVTLVGGILSCLSFVMSTFSSNIYVFILTFGLLAGCSCGLVFIPSIIIVNEYFHLKRGIANGIISSGSGAGLLVLGPIINVLLEMYSLNGAILVLAGLLLNMCVFSSLYRQPLLKRRSESGEWDEGHGQVTDRSQTSSLSSENENQTCLLVTVKDVLEESEDRQKQDIRQVSDVSDHISEKGSKIKSVHNNICDQGQERLKPHQKYVLAGLKPSMSASSHRPGFNHIGHYSLKSQSQYRYHPKVVWKSDHHLDSKTIPQQINQHSIHLSMHNIQTWYQNKSGCRTSLCSHQHQGHHDHPQLHHSYQPLSHQYSGYPSISYGSSFYLAGDISTLVNLHNKYVIHTMNRTTLKTLPINNGADQNPVQTHHGLTELSTCQKINSEKLIGQDIAVIEHNKGSDLDKSMSPFTVPDHEPALQPLVPVHPSASLMESEHNLGNVGNINIESVSDKSFGYSISQLMCMPSFHLFCLGASLIQIAYPLAGTFLADFAYHHRLERFQVAILMGLLGGLNICGRLLAGVLASLNVDPLRLNNVSLLLGGAVCLLSPLYNEFWSFCVFASGFGFFLGFFPPLQPLIIVEYFGLGSMTSAFGFLSTIKGVASILGAPLAGWIYDKSRQYSMSFIFGGSVLVLSALIHCLMPYSRRLKIKGRLSELEADCQS